MFLFMDKVTIRSKVLALVITKFTSVILLLAYNSFVYNKSRSTSQLINGKLSDPQKLLRHLSGIVFFYI